MDRRFALVVALLLALLTPAAHAGYALARPPSGWVKTSAGATFKAPHTFPGNDGYFRTTASVNVGGRMVDLPVGLQVAANAAEFVAPALAAAAGSGFGPAVIGWLAALGISWAVNQWLVEDNGGAPISGRAWVANIGTVCRDFGEKCSLTQAKAADIAARTAWRNMEWTGNFRLKSGDPGGSGRVDYEYELAYHASWQADGDPKNKNWSEFGSYPSEGLSEKRPATEQDWLSITGQLPVAVAQELAAKMPLPVALPEAAPLRVPVSPPEPVPGTNPQEHKQQVVDIVPSPSVAEPWRVLLKPGEITTTDPAGVPDPIELQTGDPAATPGDPLPPDQQQLCDVYPDVLACQKLDVIEAEEIPDETKSLAVNPESGFGEGAGSCPADKTFSVMGKQMAFKWTMICDFASGIRPVVIAVAWLSAAFGFLGLSRKGD